MASRHCLCYTVRGRDELANRALKDFCCEQLPFERFAAYAARYSRILIGSFLLEFPKEDVGDPVVAVGAYANNVRRKLNDFEEKIVSQDGKVSLKFTTGCWIISIKNSPSIF